MSINIKNEETCRLARELARLTGDTVTGAITVALCERLEREQLRRDIQTRTRKLRSIAERCAEHMGPGPSAVEHGDMLYDDQGLPNCKSSGRVHEITVGSRPVLSVRR